MVRYVMMAILACGIRTGGAYAQEDFTGEWSGTINAGGAELRLVVKLANSESGYSGTLDSPDQGASDLALSDIVVDGDSLSFTLSVAAASYAGEYDADAATVRGTWSQGGASLPLSLKRGGVEPLNRPQEPKPPFPYTSIDVEFDHLTEAGVNFAGTLTVPEGEGPFPAALLVTGSGQQDRDETIFGHKPFLLWADYLTRRGIAVLRVDDRGVGGSKGPVAAATTRTFAGDAASAVDFLKRQLNIDSAAIGLIGHSEGGQIAPIVATEFADIAFAVLLAGPSVSGEEILLEQTKLIARANGMPENTLQKTLGISRRIYKVLERETEPAAAKKQLREFYDGLSAVDQALAGYSPDRPNPVLDQLSSPWFLHFVKYDPRADLQRLTCPVLALYGEKDLQVPPEQNAAIMRSALIAAPTQDFAVEIFPGLNHLFQTAEKGSPLEYGRIEETIAPAVLERVATWLEERFGQ